MALYEDFDAPTGPTGKPSGSFKLGGRKWTIRPRDDVPWELIRRLTIGPELPPEDAPDEVLLAAGRQSIVHVDEFFESTLMPDEVDDFLAMFHDPRSDITRAKVQRVNNLVQRAIFSEEEGPTKASGPKSPGRTSTGRTSGGASRSRVTPPKR